MVKITSKIKAYSVSQTPPASVQAAPVGPSRDGLTHEADRRLVLRDVPTPLADSLRWEHRPDTPSGNPCHAYAVRVPDASLPAGSRQWWVFIGHLPNGAPTRGYPFEVFIGGEAPRTLAALCRSLSMDMRSRDRGWLKSKLDSLAKVADAPFDHTMPDGMIYRVPSEVACFAKLVAWRCAELGAFDADQLVDTPVLDALMSRREPKATTDGTLAWNAPVENPATGDHFELFLKEGLLADGQRRPFSLWLSGAYPKSLDGLCKTLSLDLRVSDLAWGVRKLKQLVDVAEPQGEFMAPIPGAAKSGWFPSTVAYVATLVLHRLHQLGWVNELYDVPMSRVVQLTLLPAPSEQDATPVIEARQGNLCPDCGAWAVVKSDGCETCRSCGMSKCA